MGTNLKANFKVKNKYGAFYTGGKIQFSETGDYMFCQNGDKVQVLEVNTGQVYKTIGQEAEDEVTSFVLSPDQQMLVVAGKSLLLRQYDWKENTVARTWKAIHVAPVSCMSFDVTSTLLATGGSDATIKVWDVIKQYCTHNLRGHSGVISITKFHPDISKLQLYSAGEDYKVRVWDLQTSVCIAMLESHYSVITALQFSPDQSTLYCGGRDNIVSVWDLVSMRKQKTIPVYESVEGLVLVPSEGKHLRIIKPQHPHFITAGAKGVLKVWNATTSNCVQTLEMTSSPASDNEGALSAISALSYNKALDTVNVVTYDHNIIMYKMEDLSLHKQFVGYHDDILDIKFLGVNDSHLVVATNSELIKVFAMDTWDCQILRGHTDTVLCLDVSKDKRHLVSASKDNSIMLWRQSEETGSVHCVAEGQGHTNSVQSVAFSRLGNKFVVSGSQDLTLKMWALPSDLSTEAKAILHSKVTEKAHDKDINSIVVSPNDKLVATGSQDKTAKLWNASSLSLLGVFRGHKRGIWCVQFSPVDQCLATASADGTIKIWALSDYSCVKTLEGHDSSVLKLSFLSRGMQILSTGSDGLMKLWTIKTSECVNTYDQHEDKVWALACSQGEDIVITGGGDSNIMVWKDVTIEEQEEVRAKQEDFILKEQKLQNLIQQKKYRKAIGLAINLDQPFRVLAIVKDILLGEEGKKDLETTIGQLRDYQIDSVLRYASSWNTNAKHCHTTQTVLAVLFKSYTPEELMKMPNFKSSLEGLIPYTERHCLRLTKVQQRTTFVDYTWQCMRLVTEKGKDSVDYSEDSGVEISQDDFAIDKNAARTKMLNTKVSSESSDSDSDESSGEETYTKVKPKQQMLKKAATESSGSSDESNFENEDLEMKSSSGRKAPESEKLEMKGSSNSDSESGESEMEASDSESDSENEGLENKDVEAKAGGNEKNLENKDFEVKTSSNVKATESDNLEMIDGSESDSEGEGSETEASSSDLGNEDLVNEDLQVEGSGSEKDFESEDLEVKSSSSKKSLGSEDFEMKASNSEKDSESMNLQMESVENNKTATSNLLSDVSFASVTSDGHSESENIGKRPSPVVKDKSGSVSTINLDLACYKTDSGDSFNSDSERILQKRISVETSEIVEDVLNLSASVYKKSLGQKKGAAVPQVANHAKRKLRKRSKSGSGGSDDEPSSADEESSPSRQRMDTYDPIKSLRTPYTTFKLTGKLSQSTGKLKSKTKVFTDLGNKGTEKRTVTPQSEPRKRTRTAQLKQSLTAKKRSGTPQTEPGNIKRTAQTVQTPEKTLKTPKSEPMKRTKTVQLEQTLKSKTSVCTRQTEPVNRTRRAGLEKTPASKKTIDAPQSEPMIRTRTAQFKQTLTSRKKKSTLK